MKQPLLTSRVFLSNDNSHLSCLVTIRFTRLFCIMLLSFPCPKMKCDWQIAIGQFETAGMVIENGDNSMIIYLILATMINCASLTASGRGG